MTDRQPKAGAGNDQKEIAGQPEWLTRCKKNENPYCRHSDPRPTAITGRLWNILPESEIKTVRIHCGRAG